MISLTLLDASGTFKLGGSTTSKLTFAQHSQDPDDPNLFHPKHPPCDFRLDKCRISGCKKRVIFEWFCAHFDKAVGYKDCVDCNARQSVPES